MKPKTQKRPASAFLPPRNIVQITPRIPAELKQQVEEAAKRLGVTMNDFVESSLNFYLQELQVEGAASPKGA